MKKKPEQLEYIGHYSTPSRCQQWPEMYQLDQKQFQKLKMRDCFCRGDEKTNLNLMVN